MPRAVCTKCNVALKPETNGVAVAETFQGDTKIYKIWHADLWACPGCGMKVILGFADKPEAEHSSENLPEALLYLRKKFAKGEAYFWYERVHALGEKPTEVLEGGE